MIQSGYKTNRISHRRGLLHLYFKPNKYISVYLCFEFYRCLFLNKLCQYTCIKTQPHKVWEIFFVPSMQPYSNRYLCLAQNALTKITIKHTQMHTFIHRYDFQVIQPLKFICCLKEQGFKTTWLKISWISWASFCKMRKVSNDNIEILHPIVVVHYHIQFMPKMRQSQMYSLRCLQKRWVRWSYAR